MGQANAAWSLLRHTTDNSARSYLIHYLGAMNVDSAIIVRGFEGEPDVSVRRALILSLGGFRPSQIPAASRQTLIPRLLDWYRNDPDGGIHSAIDWLLRHGSQGEKPRMLDWHQAGALVRIDRELAGRPAQQRGWYVTREGQTLAILRGPFQFRMGAPSDEPGRKRGPDSPDEPPRSFANVWEWTQDRMQETFSPVMDDSEDPLLTVTDTQCRSRRGGAFPYGAPFQRAANRGTLGACPAVRRDNVGFRIARTLAR